MAARVALLHAGAAQSFDSQLSMGPISEPDDDETIGMRDGVLKQAAASEFATMDVRAVEH